MKIIAAEVAPPELLGDYLRLTDSALRSVREPSAGLFIAESLTILQRALDSGHSARSVLTGPKWLPALEALLEDYPETASLPVIVGTDEDVESLTGFHLHRGTLASMNRRALPSLEELMEGARTLVILEDIVDHTNVGALFRSVAGMGADGVIVTPRCADPLYRRSVRVSMGTVFQVPWTRVESLTELVTSLHDHGWLVAGLSLDDRAIDFDTWLEGRPSKIAVALGSEGHGLSPEALELADLLVRIEMDNGVDSLNVAAAGAVALYGLRRAGH